MPIYIVERKVKHVCFLFIACSCLPHRFFGCGSIHPMGGVVKKIDFMG